MTQDQSASRSDGELLEDVDYILAKLDQRVLTTDGGKADSMVHHWNLTEGDSAMHREAAAHIRALVEKLAAVRSEQLTPLERYALAVLDAHREEIGDLDGAFLQDKAEECGLLYYVEVTEPCGEYCRCAEYDDFPQQCLRLKPEFEPKMAAARQCERPDSTKEKP